jgi:hypothetical protein
VAVPMARANTIGPNLGRNLGPNLGFSEVLGRTVPMARARLSSIVDRHMYRDVTLS